MSDAADVLVVATTRRWMAQDLAAESPVPVVHDLGLDLPLVPPQLHPAWWTPTEHAARLRAGGVPFAPAACGPRWLSELPTELTGRPIWSGTVADLEQAPRQGWSKPAEAKVAGLPAAWRTSSDLAAAAAAAGLPSQALVQLSPVRLHLTEEHRFTVTDTRVTSGSWYLAADATYDPAAAPDVDARSAAAFAADVTAALGDGQPRSYTLDVGRTDGGRWVVIEGNPVWSSAMYGCAPGPFAAAVLAAFDRPGRWAWQPDAWLDRRVSAQRPLRPASPLWLTPAGELADLRP